MRTGAAALYRCGLLQKAFQRRRGLRILCYHGVCADQAVGQPETPAHYVGAGEFARHLEIIRHFGPVVFLPEALDRGNRPGPTGPPAIAITFDDVPACTFQYARPVLEAQDLRASFFVATGHAGSGRLFWSDVLRVALRRPELLEPAQRESLVSLRGERGIHKRLSVPVLRERLEDIALTVQKRLDPASLELLRPITWSEIRQLADAGHDIGGHTVDHAILSREAPEERARQVHQCVADLEAHLGRQPLGFAYPNGGPEDFGPTDAALLRELGLRYAVTTRPGFADGEDRFSLPRICIGAAHRGPRFALELSGLLDGRAQRQRGWR